MICYPEPAYHVIVCECVLCVFFFRTILMSLLKTSVQKWRLCEVSRLYLRHIYIYKQKFLALSY